MKNIPDPGRRIGGWTMHEAGELIRRVGITKQLVSVSEYPVQVDGKPRKIDWVWMKGEKVVAAFEIEGCDVKNKSLRDDIGRFKAVCLKNKNCHCFVVTYDVRFFKGGTDRQRGWGKLSMGHEQIEKTIHNGNAKWAVLEASKFEVKTKYLIVRKPQPKTRPSKLTV